MKIGDKIKDIEDGDCYYEGVIYCLCPFKYIITKIVWNGEEIINYEIGAITEQKWWFVTN